MRLFHSLISWLRRSSPSREKDQPKETLPESGGRSLRLRLLLTVIIALTPAAIVNIVQGMDRVQQDVAGVRDRLIQTARTAAADAENVLSSAEQAARSLAARPEVRTASSGCMASLTDALKGVAYFTNLSRVNAQGDIVCAAVPPPREQINVSNRPWWAEAAHRTGFFVAPQSYSVTAQRNVLSGVLPLQSESGTFDGVILVAMDVAWIDFMLHTKQIAPGALAAVFDAANDIVATNDKDAATQIFAKAVKPASGSSELIAAPGLKGEPWSYALVTLRGGDTYVGVAMSDRELFTGTFLRVATDLLLPVLMLGLASISIWIATDRLVIQWIVYLRRIATAYARGHYAIRPVVLEEAPSEFRTLGETFSSMAAAVQDRDRSLRDALAQKSLLIKETHHRVKNNLQIVMSLLSLQAGQLRDAAAQDALRQAQVRVNALALVHRILHEIENLETVDLKRLMEDLVHQIHEGFGAQRRDLRLEVAIASRQVSSDIAVPLTLFTVEVLTNAFKHAYPDRTRGGVIKVELSPMDLGKLRLAVEDDGMGVSSDAEKPGVGSRLIKAFAQQVGGIVAIGPNPGGGTLVTLVFNDPMATPALSEEAETV